MHVCVSINVCMLCACVHVCCVCIHECVHACICGVCMWVHASMCVVCMRARVLCTHVYDSNCTLPALTMKFRMDL